MAIFSPFLALLGVIMHKKVLAAALYCLENVPKHQKRVQGGLSYPTNGVVGHKNTRFGRIPCLLDFGGVRGGVFSESSQFKGKISPFQIWTTPFHFTAKITTFSRKF